MCKLLISFFLFWNWICSAQHNDSQDSDWFIKANTSDEGAIRWLKGHLKERLGSENFLKNPLEKNSLTIPLTDCLACGSGEEGNEEFSNLYVFMSFSLEDSLWIQLSKELEKIGGVFVLRGLPKNSFEELANRLFELEEKGVAAPIQIHPKLFQECDVKLVPAIVVMEGNRYDKISGNLSIKYALEKMSQQGETSQAKALYLRWKSQESS